MNSKTYSILYFTYFEKLCAWRNLFEKIELAFCSEHKSSRKKKIFSPYNQKTHTPIGTYDSVTWFFPVYLTEYSYYWYWKLCPIPSKAIPIKLWLVFELSPSHRNQNATFSAIYIRLTQHKFDLCKLGKFIYSPKKGIVFKIAHQRSKHVIQLKWFSAYSTQIILFYVTQLVVDEREKKSKMELYQTICTVNHTHSKFTLSFTTVSDFLCLIIQRIS